MAISMPPSHKKHTRIHSQQDGALSIHVHEKDSLRWLVFDDAAEQSIIDLHHPQQLVSPAYQAMLAALLFVPTPATLLLLGLGGGAIARYLAHHAPACRGVAVELSPVVANIAQQFFDLPGAQQNWQLHITDARDYFNESNCNEDNTDGDSHFDYMVLDIAEQTRTPSWLTEPSFLKLCRQRLSHHGVLAINLIPRNAEEFTRCLANIRSAFDTHTLCLSVPEHHNILVFAFNQRPEFNGIDQLHGRVPALTKYWALPFDQFLNQMLHDNPVGSGVL